MYSRILHIAVFCVMISRVWKPVSSVTPAETIMAAFATLNNLCMYDQATGIELYQLAQDAFNKFNEAVGDAVFVNNLLANLSNALEMLANQPYKMANRQRVRNIRDVAIRGKVCEFPSIQNNINTGYFDDDKKALLETVAATIFRCSGKDRTYFAREVSTVCKHFLENYNGVYFNEKLATIKQKAELKIANQGQSSN